MGSFSVWHWVLVFAVVVLLFGTRRLREAGNDLGAAVRGFREASRDGREPSKETP